MKTLATMILVLLGGCGSVVQPKSDITTTDAGSGSDTPPLDGDVSSRVVFVSSTTTNGNMGGLDGADAMCQQLAANAGLTGVYLAWLADTATTPAGRMNQSSGPYTLANGTIVADGFGDLVDGALVHRIDRDERGNPSAGTFVCRGGEVWSNVDTAGGRRDVEACNNWNDGSGTATGASGNVKDAGATWTEGECLPIGCDSALPIYCVEQ